MCKWVPANLSLGDNPAMNKYPIQGGGGGGGGGVEILLIDSCYRNKDKLGPHELATWLVCRRYLPKQIKSYKLCHSLLFRKLSEFKRGPVYVWSHQCTVNFLQLDADRDLIFSTLSDRLIRFSFISLSSLLCYFSVVITNHADK